MIGALALASMLLPAACLDAQSAVTITVEDGAGAALAGATVRDAAGKLLGRTDAAGQLAVACAASCRVSVAAAGFSEQTLQLQAATTIRLKPAASSEQVTVTAYRAPIASLESPVTTRLLSQHALNTTATVTLDDQLRQLPGVELFRRSSSLVANPSSQGMSLRALGSTAASRTLLTEDDVPLNDRICRMDSLGGAAASLSIQSIELVRGGASDLYGSSAIGGVMNVVPVRPTSDQAELRSSYGGEGTYDEDLLLQGKRGRWGGLVSGGMVGTDGYIQEAPLQRGPVDVASNVHAQNGVAAGRTRQRPTAPVCARQRLQRSARQRNTLPDQRHPYLALCHRRRLARTARRLAGATGLRFDGALSPDILEHLEFAQFWHSVCSYRCGETPTQFSLTPNNELGAAAHWSQPLGAGLLLVVGADVHDVRIWDHEQTFGSSAALTNLHDHQRDSAAYAEAMWVHKAWTLTASGRMDWFQNYDGEQLQLEWSSWAPIATQPPQLDQRFFDPRLGLSRKLRRALGGFGVRLPRLPCAHAERALPLNPGGNKLTNPNGNLLSERATGWEAGWLPSGIGARSAPATSSPRSTGPSRR